MKYLVMECHPAYAVVLDENGRFLKAANRNYEVGQRVENVIPMEAPREAAKSRTMTRRMWTTVATMAACLCLVIFAFGGMMYTPYGLVRMKINPDVMMTVNRMDYVIAVDGLNEDGLALIEGYDYGLKKIDQVSDELADRAAEMGYLKEDGQIRITVDSEHEQWRQVTEDRLVVELEVHTGHIVTITPYGEAQQTQPPTAPASGLVIPVKPDTDYGESDYSDPDDDDDDEGVSDYGSGDHDDGDTPYDDHEDDDDDGDTPYEKPDTSYGDSGYDKPDREDEKDSPYDDDD